MRGFCEKSLVTCSVRDGVVAYEEQFPEGSCRCFMPGAAAGYMPVEDEGFAPRIVQAG